jgi:hypothetical protein
LHTCVALCYCWPTYTCVTCYLGGRLCYVLLRVRWDPQCEGLSMHLVTRI